MTVAQPIIVARDLRKSYGTLKAVDGVSFEVAEGEVFGILGPNGAGKTTTHAGRAVSPAPAMRPGRKGAKQNQNQNDDENCRQHVSPLLEKPVPAQKRAQNLGASRESQQARSFRARAE